MGCHQENLPLACVGLALVCVALGLGCEPSPPATPREEVHYPQGEAARLAGDYDAAIDAYLLSIETEPHDPRAYYGLVDAHARRGDLDAAEPSLRSRLAADADNACVRYGLGCLAVKRGDLDTALAEARYAIAQDPHLGHGHLLLGTVHYYAGRPPDALAAWSEARKVFRRQADRKYEAWALNRTALVRRELGDLRGAVTEFGEALALHRALGDQQAEQLVLGNLGLAQADLGDLAGALTRFEEALALARDVGDLYSECWGLTNLSFLCNLAGGHRLAVEYADSAIVLARSLGSPKDELTALLTRATACNDLGDPVRALMACRRAMPLADSLADQRHRGSLWATMGRAYLSLGRFDPARDSYVRCDSLFRAIETESGSWEARIGLCEVAIQEGDTVAAVAQARETLASCADAGYAEGEEFLALFLSDLMREQGEIAEAERHATRALDLSRRDGRRTREARAHVRLSRVHLSRGDAKAARQAARQAIEIAREIRSPEITWECEAAAGYALRGSDPTRSLMHYEAAMEAVEAVRRNLRIEEFKAAYLAGRTELYFEAAELLTRLGRAADALSVCERSRARAFRDVLATGPAPISPRVELELAERQRAIDRELGTLRATRARLARLPDVDRGRVIELDRDIARVRRRWEQLRAEILLQDPQYGMLLPEVRGPQASEIADALAPAEALLEYALGSDTSLCFVVRDGGVQAVELPFGRETLAAEVQELLRPLRAPRSLSALHFDLALARRMRERLFDPVASRLAGIERLVIVPDGALHYLPFEMLVLSADPPASVDRVHRFFEGVRFLGDAYAIRYLPAASLLGFPRRAAAGATETLLAMGDPSLAGRRGAAHPGESPAAWLAPDMPPLRSSAREVAALGRLFPDARVETGVRATETRFKNLASRYRYLHLSTHAFVDEEVPLYSAIMLAPEPSSDDDGLLHAYEVLTLPLDCELVSLSGCQTGRGRLYAGEGLLGLTRSFFYAGARQALVSLWSVNDDAAAMLIEQFYRGLREGRDPARALQDAKEHVRGATIGEMSGAHPFFWAPFVLIGSTRAHLADRGKSHPDL